MHRKKTLAFFVALALVFLAAAPYSKIKKYTTDGTNRNLLNAVTVDAAAASRTVTENVSGYTKLLEYVEVTDTDSDGLTVTVTCTGSLDGTNYANVTSASTTAGARTLSTLVDTYVATGSEAFMTIHDVWGYASYKCVYAATGGDNGVDAITVQWTATVGK